MLKQLKKLSRSIRGKSDAPQPVAAQLPPDLDPRDREILANVQHATMTSPERVSALCSAVRYIQDARIPGDVVECGVWRGGSMMAVASVLQEQPGLSRHLWLYDTYEGMTAPTAEDRDSWGAGADSQLAEQDRDDPRSVWCVSQLEEVQHNLQQTGYAEAQMSFVKGPVESTIPEQVPDQIALLRLDTDWYSSTKHELEHLYPRLAPGGVLIIDDYGHWNGCRQAVDEYFAEAGIPMLLHRIDYTGRMAIKVPPLYRSVKVA